MQKSVLNFNCCPQVAEDRLFAEFILWKYFRNRIEESCANYDLAEGFLAKVEYIVLIQYDLVTYCDKNEKPGVIL